MYVVKTDYSPTSLLSALKGQDAVVSSITTAAIAQQQAIVDAAVKAGVKSFIPSEFGINTTNLVPGSGLEKILGKKIEIQKLLKKAAEENEGFSWTGVSSSLFFDWVCYVLFFKL